MALSVLRYLERSGGHHVFEADAGYNSYYQYKTGGSKRKYNGVDLVDDITHKSAILKAPVATGRHFDTRFLLRIPENLFNRESRFLQLSTFKTQNQVSPAISEIITVLPSITDSNDDYKLPKIMTLSHTNGHETRIGTEHAPCHVQQNKVSEAMFFNAILGALPGLISNALPMIGKLIPGLQKALPVVEKVAGTAAKLLPELGKIVPADIKSGKEGADQLLKNLSPETLKAILEVLQGVSAKNDNSAAAGKAETKSIAQYSHDFSIDPATLMQLAPLLEKVLSPETIKAIGDNPVKLFKAISDSALKFQKMELDHLEKINPGVKDPALMKIVEGMEMHQRNGRYSEATIAPAVLAALPALAPLLEKVLSPDMIKAVGEQPVKLFNAISEAGLKLTQQELGHLEKINPGVDDPALMNLVNSMSVKSSVSMKARFSTAYTIEFADAKAIPVGGKEKVVYDRRQKMHLPVRVQSAAKNTAHAAPISRAIFQLIVQDGDSMKVLLEKKFKVRDIQPGKPIHDITLGPDELKKLPLNRDLKLELSMNWKKGNTVEGTFKNHYVWICEGYLYQRAGNNVTQHFTLNDVSKFRNYWHKVWEGGPETHKRWKIDFECRYYYLVNDQSSNIKKLETRKQIVTDSAVGDESDGNKSHDYRRKISAKLKSGMEISLAAYNELLRQNNLTALTAEQLMAFTGQDFAREGATEARVSVDFSGRKGETAALWTYPEGNIQSYILGKATTVDPTGMVIASQEEEVFFPKFSTVHFIGTKSQ